MNRSFNCRAALRATGAASIEFERQKQTREAREMLWKRQSQRFIRQWTSMTNDKSELLSALAKAQGQWTNPPKNKTVRVPTKAGGSYDYSYADLPAILDAVRKPLSENGLALVQRLENGALTCVLGHSSGQTIESTIPVSLTGSPQEIGSRLTYFRRYLITNLLSIAADDDDDNAHAAGEAVITPKTPLKPQQGKPVIKSAPKPAGKPAAANDGFYRIPGGRYMGKRPAELLNDELDQYLADLKNHVKDKAPETLDPALLNCIEILTVEQESRKTFEEFSG